MAVAVAGRCSSDLTPSLGTSICHRCNSKKQKKKKKKKKKKKRERESRRKKGGKKERKKGRKEEGEKETGYLEKRTTLLLSSYLDAMKWGIEELSLHPQRISIRNIPLKNLWSWCLAGRLVSNQC